jgi:hypothetical protein
MKKFGLMIVVLALAAGANAATLTMSMQVDGAFTTDGSFTPVAIPTDTPAAPVLLQLGQYFEVSDLAPDEAGLVNLAFSVGAANPLENLAYPADQLGYSPENPTEGFPVATPRWFANGDVGTSSTDLQEIVATLASGLDASSPKLQFGQSGPFLVGSVFYVYDPAKGNPLLSFERVDFSVLNTTTGQYQAPATMNTATGDMPSYLVPEPATLSMLALGGLALIRRRK